MLDQDYIDWRLSDPNILEIYIYNQNYIFNLLGIQDLKEKSLPNLLKKLHSLNEIEAREIAFYSPAKHEKMLKKSTEEKLVENTTLKKIVDEYKGFQQGKIWRFLSFYRRLRKYIKNFFINIGNDGIKITFKRIFKRIKHVIDYRINLDRELNPYKYWMKSNRLSLKKSVSISKDLWALKYQPLISIVMPVYNVDVKWIRKAVNSIQSQIYKNWELCIADDASTNKRLIKYLRRIEKRKKIKVVFRKKNGHISAASNSALKLAKGEFVALMDNDDIIHPHALAEAVKLLNQKKDTDFIYSDEDKIEMNGKRVDPFFKPDWSPDLFLSTNYLSHLSIIRRKLIKKVGGFRKGYEGSQDYDLFLRVTEQTDKIEHIPEVLYSWRKIPGSTAAVYTEKDYADNTSIKALKEALKRRNIKGKVMEGLFPGSFRVKYDLKEEPLISILIPTKEKLDYLNRCISSILDKTTYKNFEIIIIDTGSREKKTLEYYRGLGEIPNTKIIHWNKRFNYSGVNNFGAENSKGKYLLLLNNDTEIITPNWIEGMLEHAQRDKIGAVGVKLLYPNNTIQHAGVVLGINGGSGKGVAGHAFRFFDRETQGFPVQKDIIRNYSAVTAACLMISKEKFKEVGGLDEKFRIAFNDVDFCLKLKEKGYYNLYTPYIELYHHESISVGKPESQTRDVDEFSKEINLMYQRWEKDILLDSFYNINLTLITENFLPDIDIKRRVSIT